MGWSAPVQPSLCPPLTQSWARTSPCAPHLGQARRPSLSTSHVPGIARECRGHSQHHRGPCLHRDALVEEAAGEVGDGVQGRSPQDVPLWHVDCLELETIGAQ